MAGKSLLK